MNKQVSVVADVKNKFQRHGLNLWFKAGMKGTLEYATGVGKTRCGVLASEYIRSITSGRILILAPTRTIRDRVWEKEFKRWGLESVYTSVETECIQTAYKWEGQHFALVVVDEIHDALSTEYSKFFFNNTYDAILGLSATIPTRKRVLLQSIAPTVHRISPEEALKNGLISPYRIYNFGVSLTIEESLSYAQTSKVIDELQEKGVQAWGLVSKRQKILHKAKNKFKVVKEIASWFENKYGLVFAQYKNDVEKIAFSLGSRAQYFHGGLNKKQTEEIINLYCDPTSSVNILTSAKKLNQGADFPKVTFAIILAGTSSDLIQIQQLGRIVRPEEGKQAILIRIYVKGTKDESWLRQSQFNMTGAIYFTDSVLELKEMLSDVLE